MAVTRWQHLNSNHALVFIDASEYDFVSRLSQIFLAACHTTKNDRLTCIDSALDNFIRDVMFSVGVPEKTAFENFLAFSSTR
jgi:hypothetical protein